MKQRILIRIVLGFLFFVPCATGTADEFVYNDHGQRDPFWPLVSSGGVIVNYDSNFSSSEMLLEGVIADGKNRLAIINGAVVEEGKMIGPYTVQQVLADRVILTKDGQTTELRMKKEE